MCIVLNFPHYFWNNFFKWYQVRISHLLPLLCFIHLFFFKHLLMSLYDKEALLEKNIFFLGHQVCCYWYLLWTTYYNTTYYYIPYMNDTTHISDLYDVTYSLKAWFLIKWIVVVRSILYTLWCLVLGK